MAGQFADLRHGRVRPQAQLIVREAVAREELLGCHRPQQRADLHSGQHSHARIAVRRLRRATESKSSIVQCTPAKVLTSSTCEFVSFSSEHTPETVFHIAIRRSAVPPPLASVFGWNGHHASALTAATWYLCARSTTCREQNPRAQHAVARHSTLHALQKQPSLADGLVPDA